MIVREPGKNQKVFYYYYNEGIYYHDCIATVLNIKWSCNKLVAITCMKWSIGLGNSSILSNFKWLGRWGWGHVLYNILDYILIARDDEMTAALFAIILFLLDIFTDDISTCEFGSFRSTPLIFCREIVVIMYGYSRVSAIADEKHLLNNCQLVRYSTYNLH